MRKEVISITMMCSPVVRVCPSLLWAWGQNTAVPSSHGHSVLQWKRACLVPVVALPGPPLVPPLGLPRCPLVWPEKALEPLQPIYINIFINILMGIRSPNIDPHYLHHDHLGLPVREVGLLCPLLQPSLPSMEVRPPGQGQEN